MITLLDLPVLPKDRDNACGTCTILETYIKERDSINNSDELVEFVKRWKNIWLLRKERTSEENDLSESKFDAVSVFELLIRMRNKEDGFDYDQYNTRIAANIAVPPSSLDAFLFSKQFEVGSDLGFIRLYLDTYPEHEKDLRC